MTEQEQTAWSVMLAGLAEDAAAGRLDPDPDVVARKRHAERMRRATLTLRDAPTPRRHAERMAAARGVHLTAGADLATRTDDRRRVLAHRATEGGAA